MNSNSFHPIVWNQDIGAYVYVSEGYNGGSTKMSGRIASEASIQHFIARQLEVIALSLLNRG